MEIETKNASLDTLAVTIRALHVSGKQMTLAVFKQLPELAAFTENGELGDFEPWGTVRYAIKDCADRWLVASKDGILYRCSLRIDWPDSVDARRRDFDSIRKTLLAYEEWQKAKIKYDLLYEEWKKRPDRNAFDGMPREPYPPNRCRWEIGDQCYRDRFIESKLKLEKAELIEKTMLDINRLPQLFIAV